MALVICHCISYISRDTNSWRKTLYRQFNGLGTLGLLLSLHVA
jgi:hypothetical protein